MTQRRLKVYVTQIGVHEVIVAAPNQSAALVAWGIERNLFLTGRAHDTRDKDACAVALQAPGQVFARPRGSDKPFRPINDKAAAREGDGSSDE